MIRPTTTPRQTLDGVAGVLGGTGGALVVIGSLLPWIVGSRVIAMAPATRDGLAAAITAMRLPMAAGVDLQAGKMTLVLGVLGCVLGAALVVGAAGIRRRLAGMAFLVLASLTAAIAIVGAFQAVGNEPALNERLHLDSSLQWAVGGAGVPVMILGVVALIAAFGVGMVRGEPDAPPPAVSTEEHHTWIHPR